MNILNKPNIDEFFEAFSSSIIENIPSSIKSIWILIHPYIWKAKDSIYTIMSTNKEGQIIIDINKEILDNIIWDFISKQWFIVRNILKPIMISNHIENIETLILSVKNGKNNYEKTTETITKILKSTISKLSNKYIIKEDLNSINEKVKSIFL